MGTHEHEHGRRDDDDRGPNYGHDHDHGHGSRFSEVELRVKALESLLVDKGLVDPAAPVATVLRKPRRPSEPCGLVIERLRRGRIRATLTRRRRDRS